LARTLRNENSMRSPILAMAQPSHLERRLVALLDPALNRLAATPWSVIVVALVAIGLTLPLAAVRAPERVSANAVTPTSVSKTADASKAADVVTVPVELKAAVARLDEPIVATTVPPTPSTARELLKEEAPASARATIQVQPESPTGTQMAKIVVPAGAEPRAAAPPPIECRVSPVIQETKMKETKMALGSGPWHINADRTIWAWDQPYIAGAAVNTMWMKPANEDLIITGRRLDGESAPLKIQLAKDSTAGYIATAMTFPKAGCWEVTATSGSSTLTYITRVDAQ